MQTTTFSYNNSATNFLIDSRYRLARHILLILLIAIIVFYNSIIIYKDAMGEQKNIITTQSILSFILYLGAIYLNIYVLVPRFLLARKHVSYILFFILIILGLLLILDIPGYFINRSNQLSFQLIITQIPAMAFTYAICLAGSCMPVLLRHWITSGKRMNELERITIKSELEYLKAQIHPGFLFNVLDKAVILTQKAPEQASATLLRLSKLLRYQLYDSTREKVLLNSEITFLENFIELEKDRRNGNGFTFSISKEGNINQTLIPPLLLAPFVEYIINHIDNNEKGGSMHLVFHVEENQFQFLCLGTNMIKDDKNNDLLNVKRRLNLLFGNSYTLELTENSTNLSLKLYLSL